MQEPDKKLARTIAETYRTCNPELPLSAEDHRYVDLTASRGTRHIAKSIARSIRRSEASVLVKQLFTGHRGSGKTTELLRLKKELEDNEFFVVYMDVEELLDLGSLSYLDVLVAIAKQVQADLHAKHMPLPESLLENIAKWFNEHVIEKTASSDLQVGLETEAKAGSSIPFFAQMMARVTASFKAGSSTRETIRQKLSKELVVFIRHLNLLISAARQAVQDGKFVDLVLIVDGMEKMHYELSKDGESTYSQMFIRHAEQLRSPQCHIVYTVPVSLVYHQNLGSEFEAIAVLPMVKVDDQGLGQLIDVVKKRVETEQVFANPSLLLRLAKSSGGVVRDLMRLVRMATDTDAEQIGAADVDYAVSQLRNEYDRLIRTSDLASFCQIRQNRRIQGGDENAARLLNLRLALEYQNGERWADLHPMVLEIPWVKKALALDGPEQNGAA